MTNTVESEVKLQSLSEQEARAQAASIAEMVQRLTRQGAAELHCAGMDRGALEAFLLNVNPLADVDSPYGTEEQLHEHAAQLIADEIAEPDGFEWDVDSAREAIQENPLSVQVRSGWHAPGDGDGAKPEEFEILLCTGGPAVRIRGELNDFCEPTRAWIEHQDWGTGWQQLFNAIEQDTLLTYCQQFYFGE